MRKLGMFDSNNYRSEVVIRGIAKIPLKKVGFLCGFGALVGGPVALVGMLSFLKLKSIPIDLTLSIAGMFIGGFLFLIGMTVPYIVYLSKEVTNIKDCLHSIPKVYADPMTDPESEEAESGRRE